MNEIKDDVGPTGFDPSREAALLRRALLAVRLVRPSNWDDGDDPELTEAWQGVDDALAQAPATAHLLRELLASPMITGPKWRCPFCNSAGFGAFWRWLWLDTNKLHGCMIRDSAGSPEGGEL